MLFVFCLTLCYFVLMFFSPFSIATTSLGEERANLSAFRSFVRLALVWLCLFPLLLGVWEELRFVIVARPGLFFHLFLPTDRSKVGLGGSVGCAVRQETRRSRVQPRRGRQYSFVEIDHEILSTVILSLPLIQEGQLSVSGERMCTILVNRLEDSACPVNVWLGKLTALDMTPLGWLGRKTSTQTRPFQGVLSAHYENTPIQIYRKFHHQKLKVFR